MRISLANQTTCFRRFGSRAGSLTQLSAESLTAPHRHRCRVRQRVAHDCLALSLVSAESGRQQGRLKPQSPTNGELQILDGILCQSGWRRAPRTTHCTRSGFTCTTRNAKVRREPRTSKDRVIRAKLEALPASGASRESGRRKEGSGASQALGREPPQ